MIGIDVVDVARLRRVLEQTPGVVDRMFTPAEIEFCNRLDDPVVHLAGTLAAKEATVKALGLSGVHEWAQRITVSRDGTGAPSVSVQDREDTVMISISHDAGVAVAVALRADR